MKSLQDRLRKACQDHIEKDNGLIAGPDRLLNRLITGVELWLAENDQPKHWRSSDVDYRSIHTIIRSLKEIAKEKTHE